MPEIKSYSANECIYCGSIETERSKEHVIPFSLGGDFVIHQASCSKCAKLTQKFEQDVSRESYKIVRAMLNIRTRRPKEMPDTVPNMISYGKFGPRESVEIPLDQAYVTCILPHFEVFQTHNSKTLATYVLHESPLPNRERSNERAFALLKKYRAYSIESYCGLYIVGSFVQTLWKIAYGFFYILYPKSLKISNVVRYIYGKENIKSVLSNNNKFLVENLYSIPRYHTETCKPKVRVFCGYHDGTGYVDCEIDILGGIGTPLYYCRILRDPSEAEVEYEYS